MAATHHIVIACADEPEAHRKKEGDILEVRTVEEIAKYGGWGKVECKHYLMLPAKNLTGEEARGLKCPLYEDDSVGEFDKVKIGKARYTIPLDILKSGWKTDLIEADIRNKDKDYQPFMDGNIVLDFSEQVAIVKDKSKDAFKYKKIKQA